MYNLIGARNVSFIVPSIVIRGVWGGGGGGGAREDFSRGHFQAKKQNKQYSGKTNLIFGQAMEEIIIRARDRNGSRTPIWFLHLPTLGQHQKLATLVIVS